MTPQTLNFDPPLHVDVIPQKTKTVDPESMLGKVATLFMRKRGLWLDSSELAQVGGRCGWRTRVSECRTVLGMVIENRVRTIKTATGKYVVSEYGYGVKG